MADTWEYIIDGRTFESDHRLSPEEQRKLRDWVWRQSPQRREAAQKAREMAVPVLGLMSQLPKPPQPSVEKPKQVIRQPQPVSLYQGPSFPNATIGAKPKPTPAQQEWEKEFKEFSRRYPDVVSGESYLGEGQLRIIQEQGYYPTMRAMTPQYFKAGPKPDIIDKVLTPIGSSKTEAELNARFQQTGVPPTQEEYNRSFYTPGNLAETLAQGALTMLSMGAGVPAFGPRIGSALTKASLAVPGAEMALQGLKEENAAKALAGTALAMLPGGKSVTKALGNNLARDIEQQAARTPGTAVYQEAALAQKRAAAESSLRQLQALPAPLGRLSATEARIQKAQRIAEASQAETQRMLGSLEQQGKEYAESRLRAGLQAHLNRPPTAGEFLKAKLEERGLHAPELTKEMKPGLVASYGTKEEAQAAARMLKPGRGRGWSIVENSSGGYDLLKSPKAGEMPKTPFQTAVESFVPSGKGLKTASAPPPVARLERMEPHVQEALQKNLGVHLPAAAKQLDLDLGEATQIASRQAQEVLQPSVVQKAKQAVPQNFSPHFSYAAQLDGAPAVALKAPKKGGGNIVPSAGGAIQGLYEKAPRPFIGSVLGGVAGYNVAQHITIDKDDTPWEKWGKIAGATLIGGLIGRGVGLAMEPVVPERLYGGLQGLEAKLYKYFKDKVDLTAIREMKAEKLHVLRQEQMGRVQVVLEHGPGATPDLFDIYIKRALKVPEKELGPPDFAPIPDDVLSWEQIGDMQRKFIGDKTLGNADKSRGIIALNMLKRGYAPIESEIPLLERALGPGVGKLLQKVIPQNPWVRAGRMVANTLNPIKLFMSSMDLSAMGFQGAMMMVTQLLSTKPGRPVKVFLDQFKALVSQEEVDKFYAKIYADPDFGRFTSGQILREPLRLTKEGRPFAQPRAKSMLGYEKPPRELTEAEEAAREEGFRTRTLMGARLHLAGRPGSPMYKGEEMWLGSRIVQDVPGVQATERAYNYVLDALRWNDMKAITAFVERKGTPLTQRELRALGNYVNVKSGRGGFWGPATTAANTVIYSPRYAISQIEFALGIPLANAIRAGIKSWGATSPKAYRLAGAILWDMGKTYAGYYAALHAFKAAGFDVGLDPHSSKFGHVRIGDTWYSFGSGLFKAIRFMTQMGDTAEGGKTTLEALSRGTVKEYKSGLMQPATRGELVWRHVRGTLSPAASVAVDVLTGRTYLGDPVTGSELLGERTVPLAWQDIGETVQRYGLKEGLMRGWPALFGFGVTSEVLRKGETAPVIKDNIVTLYRQHNYKKATELLNRARTEGRLDAQDLREIYRDIHLPPEIARFQDLSLENAIFAFRKAPLETKELLRPFLHAKVMNARERTVRENLQELLAAAREYMEEKKRSVQKAKK